MSLRKCPEDVLLQEFILKQWPISEFTKASSSKQDLVHSHLYENEFNLQVNEISFPYKRTSTKTRFDEAALVNSEIAYSIICSRFL